ncbi:MAG: anthranilate synthase component I [Victivallaceae bacterium]|nr:anthranilate synthase component I [Victivallaceae bacterium]
MECDFADFSRRAAESDIVPVFRRVIADLETPVSVLARFSDDQEVFLLESIEAGKKFGRYSFIGINPKAVFTIENGKAYLAGRDGVRHELPAPDGPFMALQGIVGGKRVAPAPGLPPLFGGAVGYLGYETVNQFEKLPAPKSAVPGPESAMLITDEMIIFDNLEHTMTVSVAVHTDEFDSLRAAFDDAQQRIAVLVERLKQPIPPLQAAKVGEPRLESNMTREAFCAMVESGRRHIFEGDVIQVVLSQKFSAEADIPPLQLYRALRLVNPSPYTFFLRTAGRVLVGSSPETLVKFDGETVTVRPIAGTRPRGATTARDIELADELLSDEKERAEHLMLVDLGRNDVGRIARPGSVQVKGFMTVERYSHVMHLVTTVEALPREGINAFDIVRATFPAGTLSGAPKVRAMEIIHELEPEPRGVYGGAVGYFSYSSSMDLAITIRTVLMENGRISVQSGAGIVYDSDPEAEYRETVNKAAAMMKSLRLAAANLEL